MLAVPSQEKLSKWKAQRLAKFDLDPAFRAKCLKKLGVGDDVEEPREEYTASLDRTIAKNRHSAIQTLGAEANTEEEVCFAPRAC